MRAALERAWVSTVHGFCARLLRENAVFAGVDPEFRVADERESWRMQQEAMAAAMESLFREQPEGVRALIRGLSSIDFEEAVLSAYDAMRGRGHARGGGCRRCRRRPAGRLAEIAGHARGVAAGAAADVERVAAGAVRRRDRRRGADSLGRERARGAGGHRGVRVQSAEVQARERAPTSCLKHLKAQVEEARYALITEYYAPQRALLFEILRRFDRFYRDAQAAGRRARLLRPGRVHGAAARGQSGDARAAARRSSTTS